MLEGFNICHDINPYYFLRQYLGIEAILALWIATGTSKERLSKLKTREAERQRDNNKSSGEIIPQVQKTAQLSRETKSNH